MLAWLKAKWLMAVGFIAIVAVVIGGYAAAREYGESFLESFWSNFLRDSSAMGPQPFRKLREYAEKIG